MVSVLHLFHSHDWIKYIQFSFSFYLLLYFLFSKWHIMQNNRFQYKKISEFSMADGDPTA